MVTAGSSGTMEAPLLAGEQTVDSKTVRLGFVAGVIQQEKLIAFERLLFRATRGNMFLKSTPVGSVLDPTTGEKQEKAVFVVFFAGERARTKILKVQFCTNRNTARQLLLCSIQKTHWDDPFSCFADVSIMHFSLSSAYVDNV